MMHVVLPRDVKRFAVKHYQREARKAANTNAKGFSYWLAVWVICFIVAYFAAHGLAALATYQVGR